MNAEAPEGEQRARSERYESVRAREAEPDTTRRQVPEAMTLQMQHHRCFPASLRVPRQDLISPHGHVHLDRAKVAGVAAIRNARRSLDHPAAVLRPPG